MVFKLFSRNHHAISQQPLLKRSASNSSVSSTFSVGEANKKTRNDDNNNNCCHANIKKSVTFNLSFNEAHINKVMCSEDCKDLWYTDSDYIQFRETARTTGKAIVRLESQKSVATFSYKNVMEFTYDRCLNVSVNNITDFNSLSTEQERRHLIRWAGVDTRLGLEKRAVRRLGKGQKMRREDIVDTVLGYQDDFLVVAAENGQRCDEIIRECSERISRPSRVFATVLGHAQAAALRDESDNQDFFA